MMLVFAGAPDQERARQRRQGAGSNRVISRNTGNVHPLTRHQLIARKAAICRRNFRERLVWSNKLFLSRIAESSNTAHPNVGITPKLHPPNSSFCSNSPIAVDDATYKVSRLRKVLAIYSIPPTRLHSRIRTRTDINYHVGSRGDGRENLQNVGGKTYTTMVALAEHFGVHYSTVNGAVRGSKAEEFNK
jgi:hypothetical protein